MANILYGFQGLVGSVTNPATGSFIITGDDSGIAKISWSMSGDVTEHEVSADGSTIISAIARNNGTLSIETYQNSQTDIFLMNWFNTLDALKAQHVLANWTSTVVSVTDTASLRAFTFTGVSPKKQPDRSYGAQAATVSWEMMAAKLTQE